MTLQGNCPGTTRQKEGKGGREGRVLGNPLELFLTRRQGRYILEFFKNPNWLHFQIRIHFQIQQEIPETTVGSDPLYKEKRNYKHNIINNVVITPTVMSCVQVYWVHMCRSRSISPTSLLERHNYSWILFRHQVETKIWVKDPEKRIKKRERFRWLGVHAKGDRARSWAWCIGVTM